MKYLILLFAFSLTVPIHAASHPSRRAMRLAAPPAGATLPVALGTSLKARQVTVGQTVTARLFQCVPLSDRTYLPAKAEIVGHVASVNNSSLSLLFTELRWKGQTVPIHVRLLAAASSNNVYQTKLPVGGTDRGTASPADWTRRQVGGDEIYLSAGSGKVYDRYSQPVGYANFNGVYADPASPGELPRAMGPFSTTAVGLHGLPGFSIVSPGGADTPITLNINQPKWQIASGGALLLEVVD
jgi:hypothetical protein